MMLLMKIRMGKVVVGIVVEGEDEVGVEVDTVTMRGIIAETIKATTKVKEMVEPKVEEGEEVMAVVMGGWEAMPGTIATRGSVVLLLCRRAIYLFCLSSTLGVLTALTFGLHMFSTLSINSRD